MLPHAPVEGHSPTCFSSPTCSHMQSPPLPGEAKLPPDTHTPAAAHTHACSFPVWAWYTARPCGLSSLWGIPSDTPTSPDPSHSGPGCRHKSFTSEQNWAHFALETGWVRGLGPASTPTSSWADPSPSSAGSEGHSVGHGARGRGTGGWGKEACGTTLGKQKWGCGQEVGGWGWGPVG